MKQCVCGNTVNTMKRIFGECCCSKAAVAKRPFFLQNQEASEPIKPYSSSKTNQYTPIYIDLSKEASSVNNSVGKSKIRTRIMHTTIETLKLQQRHV